jgi:hypothetical protein
MSADQEKRGGKGRGVTVGWGGGGGGVLAPINYTV